jgi:mannan endo-1,4-beta-mannosidase
VRNLGIADLDFAVIHVYPGNWGIPADEHTWVNDNYIGARAALAAAAGKPLILEVGQGLQCALYCSAGL